MSKTMTRSGSSALRERFPRGRINATLGTPTHGQSGVLSRKATCHSRSQPGTSPKPQRNFTAIRKVTFSGENIVTLYNIDDAPASSFLPQTSVENSSTTEYLKPILKRRRAVKTEQNGALNADPVISGSHCLNQNIPVAPIKQETVV